MAESFFRFPSKFLRSHCYRQATQKQQLFFQYLLEQARIFAGEVCDKETKYKVPPGHIGFTYRTIAEEMSVAFDMDISKDFIYRAIKYFEKGGLIISLSILEVHSLKIIEPRQSPPPNRDSARKKPATVKKGNISILKILGTDIYINTKSKKTHLTATVPPPNPRQFSEETRDSEGGQPYIETDVLQKEEVPSSSYTQARPALKKKKKKISFCFINEEFLDLLEEDRDTWKELFPGVNLDQQIKQTSYWLVSNPSRYKPELDLRNLLTKRMESAYEKQEKELREQKATQKDGKFVQTKTFAKRTIDPKTGQPQRFIPRC